jgi:uncharacterized membrane protein
MRAKARLFGHPIHQMLIVFPLGLLATSLFFDIARLASGNPQWALISFWLIAVGVVTGLLAALFGLIDWLAIPADTRAKRIGLYHGLGNTVVVVLFAVSWFLRRDDVGNPTGVAVTLSVLAVLLALVTAWMGGELVDRLGVGVDDGAHLNAPSSLSGRPAGQTTGQTVSTPTPAGRR